MWKCHIHLNASPFHCSKLIKKLPEDKFPYCKAQIKSKGFSLEKKRKETSYSDKISSFFEN